MCISHFWQSKLCFSVVYIVLPTMKKLPQFCICYELALFQIFCLIHQWLDCLSVGTEFPGSALDEYIFWHKEAGSKNEFILDKFSFSRPAVASSTFKHCFVPAVVVFFRCLLSTAINSYIDIRGYQMENS